MIFIYNNCNKIFYVVSFLLFNIHNLYTGIITEDISGFRASFVIPQVLKNGKKYVLLGKESGGKDKGSYCVPGGSSGWWIFRDKDPLETAAREFCEETLTKFDYKTVYEHIDQRSQKRFILESQGKKIIGYTVLFQDHIIDDIVSNFSDRCSKTWFWQYYYREMDHFILVEWDTLISRLNNVASDGSGVVIEVDIFDNKSLKNKKQLITLRPITVLLIKKYQKKADV